MFIKERAFKCLLKIHFWREIDNATFYFLIFLLEILSENSISIPIHPEMIYFWIWLFGGAACQGIGRGGEWALMSNLCLISHRWHDVEKLTVPGSSNLNLSFSGAQQNVLCQKDERKMWYILFYQSKCKGFSKIIGGRVTFSSRS